MFLYGILTIFHRHPKDAGKGSGLLHAFLRDSGHSRAMTHGTAIGFDTSQKVTLKSLDLTAAAALTVPLQVLAALDTCHLDGSKLSEHLSGNIFHSRRAATCLAGEILFLQHFTGRVTVRTVLVKAIADLRMEKTVGCDLDQISTVAAAQPDHLAIKALRCLFDRNQMTKTFILDIFYLSTAVFCFFISYNSRHTSKNNPLFFRFVQGFQSGTKLFYHAV